MRCAETTGMERRITGVAAFVLPADMQLCLRLTSSFQKSCRCPPHVQLYAWDFKLGVYDPAKMDSADAKAAAGDLPTNPGPPAHLLLDGSQSPGCILKQEDVPRVCEHQLVLREAIV